MSQQSRARLESLIAEFAGEAAEAGRAEMASLRSGYNGHIYSLDNRHCPQPKKWTSICPSSGRSVGRFGVETELSWSAARVFSSGWVPPGRLVVRSMIEHPSLIGRDEAVKALEQIHAELTDGKADDWENVTLATFLEALGALLEVIELTYTNVGKPIPDNPWAMVARAIRGARYYE